MDWSKLHTSHLELPSARVLRSLKGAVPSLKHIEFAIDDLRNWNLSVDYALTLSLGSIRITGFDKLVDGLIHGRRSSLKHLTINKFQTMPLFLNDTTISRLSYPCPSLQTFNIDMASTAEWDSPLLNELASHSQLHHLTLRLEVEDNGISE